MTFTEIEFVFFLPLVFALYWLGPRRRGYQNAVLLAASYVFFGSWHWQLLALVIAGTLLDYFIARRLVETVTQPDTVSDRQSDSVAGDSLKDQSLQHEQTRKRLLFISLAFSLGTLAFFKYAGFFVQSASDLFSLMGIPVGLPVLKFLLPLGLSYWTLQRVGYMLDVYWKRQQPESSLLNFALFCCFFGQVTAGPIARGSELLTQFAKPRYLTAKMLADGAFAFMIGYLLKAWAADLIGSGLVSPVFASPAEYNTVSLWLGAFGFAAQVFGDFAGYSLMAIGVARCFAIELPINFRTPFLSRSLPELWQRWHITLNRWLFDYIFTPLTTSRGWFYGRFNVALVLVFLASGLWHGAAWTFVLWGLLHGIGMVVHRHWDLFYRSLCRKDRVWVARRKSTLYSVVSWCLTLVFFVLTLVPFRASDFSSALDYARGMFTIVDGLSATPGLFVIGGMMLVIVHHLVELQVFQRVRKLFWSAPPLARGALYGACIAVLILIVPMSDSTFIYQQF